MSLCGHVKFVVFGVAVHIQLLPFMYEKTVNDCCRFALYYTEISVITFSSL
jgi:hypothetical protein